MTSVMINGQESAVAAAGLATVADLIELIKTSIDPEHMITGITVDGKELSDSDWSASPSRFGTSIIEVETNTPEEFVSDRLGKASYVVNACYMDFRDARKSFQEGDMQSGNKKLAKAVNTLQAFFEWFGTMIGLVPEVDRPKYNIDEQVRPISEVCKTICQQQLYQSWWALGETIEKELEPKLDKLEDFCRKFKKLV